MKRLLIFVLLLCGAANAQQLASYAFTTVENPLSDGGNFTAFSGGVLPEVPSSGVCQVTETGQFQGGAYTGISWPDNQYSELTILTCGEVYTACVIVVRDAGTSDYYFPISGLNSGALHAVVGGVDHQLAGIALRPSEPGDVDRLSVTTGATSNSISLYQNGILIGSWVDSTYYASLTSGTPGFGLNAAGLFTPLDSAAISNWAGGGFGSPPGSYGQYRHKGWVF